MDRSFRGVIRRSMSLAHARALPKDLSSSKIRRTFIDYFCEEHKHLFIRSSPVFSLRDPTLAFVNAGMNQFKDVFLGLVQPASTRVANSQKCIRILGKHNDLSQVGQDGLHHTFFEMLGNWSFGDYFKEDACRMSWDLLTNVFGIPPNRLYVTYYKGDQELGFGPDEQVREIWRQIGVDENRILPFGTKDNFWEGGVTGPCGPCTEIHYDTVPGRTYAADLVNSGSNEVIELWNLVFTQFNRKADGGFENLKTHFVDTGMGFERLVAILQGKQTNYETDLFLPLFEAIKKHTGHSGYTGQYDGNFQDNSYRILADHCRMLAVAIADGMMPKRQVRVRVVFKRALQLAEKAFGADEKLLKELTNHVAEIFSDTYPEVGRNLSKIHMLIDKEAEMTRIQRAAALSKWNEVTNQHPNLGTLDILETPQLLDGFNYVKENILKQGKFLLTGEDIWVLSDSYGVPPPISELLGMKLGLNIDMASFTKKRLSEKETSRVTQNLKSSERLETSYIDVLVKLEEKQTQPTLDYFKYDYRPDATGKYIFKEQPTTVEAILRGDQLVEEISLADIHGEEEIGLILDRTQFFVSEGGQADDTGTLQIEKEIHFDIKRLVKIKNFVIHFGTFKSFPSESKVTVKDIGVLRLDEDRRLRIMRNHTALHLLNAALRSLVPVVMEKSSAALPESLNLRFLVNDSSLHPITGITKMENFVKEFILHGVSVKRRVLNHSQFQALDDVVFIPGERIVQAEIPVVEINSGFKLSKEYCTGTHILNTSDLKDFIITKFVKGSYGSQKIDAVTGDDCVEIRRNDSERQKEWDRLRGELEDCKELEKVVDLQKTIKTFRSDLRNSEKMSHTLKLKLEFDIKDFLEELKSVKRDVIKKEIEGVSEATSEPFVVYFLEKDSNFELSDLNDLKSFESKPLILVLRQDDLIAIRCYVSKGFVTNKFSAEKWLQNAIMPFGGTIFYENAESADFVHVLKERKFAEKQLNRVLEIAGDFARKNLRSSVEVRTGTVQGDEALKNTNLNKQNFGLWIR